MSLYFEECTVVLFFYKLQFPVGTVFHQLCTKALSIVELTCSTDERVVLKTLVLGTSVIKCFC